MTSRSELSENNDFSVRTMT